MNRTKIEYLDFTWNPIAMRCTPVSEGCENCWHRRRATMLGGNLDIAPEIRDAYLGRYLNRPILIGERLNEPQLLVKPNKIGVQFMGDLFHPNMPPHWIAAIFRKTWDAPQHTYLFLTKRPERVLEFNEWSETVGMDRSCIGSPWQDNVWLGVTAENQARADERIPILLQIPAVIRFVSIEPMLGPIPTLPLYLTNKYEIDPNCPNSLNWVILGAETGPRKRPMELQWARDVRDRCREADVPFFFKKNGEGTRYLDGKMHEEWPR